VRGVEGYAEDRGGEAYREGGGLRVDVWGNRDVVTAALKATGADCGGGITSERRKGKAIKRLCM